MEGSGRTVRARRRPRRAGLAERLRRQALILRNVRDSIIVMDGAGAITYWNAGATALFGYSADEMLGRSPALLYPEANPAALTADLAAIAAGRDDVGEAQARRKDGTLIWINVRLTVLRDGAGTAAGFIGMATDISARKQAEADLAAELEAMTRLHDLGKRVARAPDLQTLLDTVLDATIALHGADFGNIQLYDAPTRTLRIAAQRGFAPPFLEYFAQVSAEEGSACGLALARGERIVIADVAQDPDYAPSLDAARAAGYQAVQSTPLVTAAGGPLGMLSTHFRQPRRFTERELRLTDLYARLASDAIAAQLLAQSLRQSAERQAFLVRLGDALRPLAGPVAVMETAARVLGAHLQVSRAHYAEVLPDGDTIVVAVDYCRDDVPSVVGRHSFAAYGGSVQDTLRAGRTLVADDDATIPDQGPAERAAYPGPGLEAAVSVPLVKAGRLAAFFTVQQATARHWTAGEIALVEETAERTWAAVERARAEAALRESEARLRRALEIETVGVIFFKATGEITYANDAFLRMSGYTPEDQDHGLVRWDEMTPPEYMPASLKAVEEFLATGRTTPYEKEYIRKDGSRWWALFAATRIDAETGIEFIIDITERKWAEAALQQSEARLREALAAAHMAAWIWDPVADRVVMSETVSEVFGLRPGEPFESSAQGFGYVHPDDVERHRALVQHAGAHGESWHGEFRIIRPVDGRVAWLEERATAARDPQTGELRMSGLVWDITERKVAEAALRASEARFRAVADLVPDLLWRNDPGGHADWYNRRWLDYTGQTLEEARGDGWFAVIHPDDRARSRATFRAAVDAGLPLRLEHRIRRAADGTYRWFLVQAEPVRDGDGGIVAWYGAATDIHAQRLAQEELEARVNAATAEVRAALAEQRALLREVNHRVKNNLEVINSLLSLQAADVDDARAQQALTEAAHRVRAIGLVHRLLYEAPSRAQVDLGRFAEELAQALVASYGVAERVRVTVSGERLATTLEHAVPLGLILNELLTNALKYAFPGDRAGRIQLRIDAADGVLELADDGIGVPASVDVGRPRTLGLQLVHALVRQVGGTLQVMPGPGTRYWLQVPPAQAGGDSRSRRSNAS